MGHPGASCLEEAEDSRKTAASLCLWSAFMDENPKATLTCGCSLEKAEYTKISGSGRDSPLFLLLKVDELSFLFLSGMKAPQKQPASFHDGQHPSLNSL